MTPTPTSGADDMPEALRRSTAADGKTELFNLPGYPLMVRAVDFNRIHAESEMRRAALLDEMQKAALAAGQATAAQQSGAKLNYSVLYVYASQHGIDYNSLCAAVHEAGAQGFRDGAASLSANAVEPVAWQYRSLRDNGAWFDCTKERFEMRCTQPEIWETRALYAAPPTSAEGVEHG